MTVYAPGQVQNPFAAPPTAPDDETKKQLAAVLQGAPRALGGVGLPTGAQMTGASPTVTGAKPAPTAIAGQAGGAAALPAFGAFHGGQNYAGPSPYTAMSSGPQQGATMQAAAAPAPDGPQVRTGTHATTTVTPSATTTVDPSSIPDPPIRVLGGQTQYQINGQWVALNPVQYQQYKQGLADAQKNTTVQGGPGSPGYGTPNDIKDGTLVRDHITGQTYTKGGDDDPALAVKAPTPGAITYAQDPTITGALQALGQQQAPAYGGPSRVRQTAGAQAATVAPAGSVGSVSAPGISAGAAPTISPVIARATAGDAAQQQDLIGLLQAAAGGGQDSAAAIQARQAAAQQEAAQMSLAASAGPAGRAAALRSAMQGVGNVEAATASNVQKGNLDAQVAARSELANVLQGMRGQNITENQSAADAQNAARMLGAQLQGAQNVAGIGAQATLGSAQVGANAQLKGAQLAADTARATTQAQLSTQAAMQKSAQDAAAAQQNAELQQQANQFAASLGMSEQQLQQSGLLGLLGIDTTRMGISQQGQVAQQQMSSNQYIAQLQAANQKAIADKAAETQLQLGQMNQGGFWDTLAKIAGPALTVIGGAVGGPAGAAIGAGVGGAVGRH